MNYCFDIQECKFNETITTVEPNLILDGFWHKKLMETNDDFKKVGICESKSVSVLELCTESGYVRITKAEAINIAKHFDLDVIDSLFSKHGLNRIKGEVEK